MGEPKETFFATIKSGYFLSKVNKKLLVEKGIKGVIQHVTLANEMFRINKPE